VCLTGDQLGALLSQTAGAAASMERGDNEKALADFTRVTEIDPAGQEGFLFRAILHQRLGRVDLALADYDKLLSIAPDEQFYRNRHATLLQQKIRDHGFGPPISNKYRSPVGNCTVYTRG
jgi:Tfp pilus assembly protein PilF